MDQRLAATRLNAPLRPNDLEVAPKYSRNYPEQPGSIFPSRTRTRTFPASSDASFSIEIPGRNAGLSSTRPWLEEADRNYRGESLARADAAPELFFFSPDREKKSTTAETDGGYPVRHNARFRQFGRLSSVRRSRMCTRTERTVSWVSLSIPLCPRPVFVHHLRAHN